ncbi:MAG: M20 metallopeptidase family protein [Bacillota bacterium]
MDILKAAKAIENDIISLRREIHMRPELGLETVQTSALVARTLRDLGLEVREHVGGYGVVGVLRGEAPVEGSRPCIALRADMDALPIVEDTGKDYCSRIPGAMHACGHDAHTAILLGTAKILSDARKELVADVKFIFQPGEEGAGGARLMIEDGCMANPKPDMVLGAHVGTLWGLASGQVGVRQGALMAATDRFNVVVRGKGGHGAAPHASVDPVVIAAQIIVALQTIVSREIDPLAPAVVTVGVINAGTANNIIPETCEFRGTVRYMDKALAEFIPRRIREISEGIAAAMRGQATVEYRYGYPPVVNDPDATEFLARAAASIVGVENVREAPQVMGGEDMSYYLNMVPGTFFGIGTGTPGKGTDFPHHHPKFDVDEEVLHKGAAVFAKACLDFGRQQAK